MLCKDDRKIAKVGGLTISQSEVKRRDDITRLYYPQEKRSLGEEQLTRAFAYAAILERHKQPITSEDLRKEASRIEQTSLMPDKLAQIKALFNGDEAMYLKVYILPTLVERLLYYEVFLHDPKIQQESLKPASDFLRTVLSKPQKFKQIAKAAGLQLQELELSANGLKYVSSQSQFRRPLEGKPQDAAIPSVVQKVLLAGGQTEATNMIAKYLIGRKLQDVVRWLLTAKKSGWWLRLRVSMQKNHHTLC